MYLDIIHIHPQTFIGSSDIADCRLLLTEYIDTMSDRLCLRLGTNILPRLFESICVDAVVKMHRRAYYEGITSEGAANISTTFVDDVLSEYADEIALYREQQSNSSGSGKVVHFI